jgi:hypothetical protein
VRRWPPCRISCRPRPTSATMWADLDFCDSVIYVRRAYVWGRFKVPKSKASKALVPMHPLLAGFLLAWRDKTPFSNGHRFCVPECQAERQEATVRVRYGAKVPEAGGGESRSHQGSREGTFWLSQLSECTGDRAGETESGGQNGAGDTAPRGLRDDYAALTHRRTWRRWGRRRASSWSSYWATGFTCLRRRFNEKSWVGSPNPGLDRGLGIFVESR